MNKKCVKMAIVLKELIDVADMCDENEANRRYWINPFLEKREVYSLEVHLLKDILWNYKAYQNFFRKSIDSFEIILNLV